MHLYFKIQFGFLSLGLDLVPPTQNLGLVLVLVCFGFDWISVEVVSITCIVIFITYLGSLTLLATDIEDNE